METTRTGVLTMWAVVLVVFVGLAGVLYPLGELTPTVVAVYWFPSVSLVAVGVFPAPWAAMNRVS